MVDLYALKIVLGVTQFLVAGSLVVLCGLQVILGRTSNPSKAIVHKLNFVSSLLLWAMTIVFIAGVYDYVLVVLWALAKGFICISIAIIFFHILEAGSKLKKKVLPKAVACIIIASVTTVIGVQMIEMLSTLNLGTRAGPYVVVDLLLVSCFSFLSIHPLKKLRSVQRSTMEFVVSSRKERLHAVQEDGILFNKLIEKLDRLLKLSFGIGVVTFALACILVAVMAMRNSPSIGLYGGNQGDSVTSIFLEASCFLVFCVITLWPVYYSWVPVSLRHTNTVTSRARASANRSRFRGASRMSPRAVVRSSLSHVPQNFIRELASGSFSISSLPDSRVFPLVVTHGDQERRSSYPSFPRGAEMKKIIEEFPIFEQQRNSRSKISLHGPPPIYRPRRYSGGLQMPSPQLRSSNLTTPGAIVTPGGGSSSGVGARGMPRTPPSAFKLEEKHKERRRSESGTPGRSSMGTLQSGHLTTPNWVSTPTPLGGNCTTRAFSTPSHDTDRRGSNEDDRVKIPTPSTERKLTPTRVDCLKPLQSTPERKTPVSKTTGSPISPTRGSFKVRLKGSNKLSPS
mmetsp:Transcript_37502/g.72665  ORF Transcript_37502/g.72665 Transcript_37502/m.72665 type:complete len:568 (-) Transcript_37502:208-1911(-)